MKITAIQEHPFGIYVWMMPGDRIVQDEDKNILCINSQEGDTKRIMAITQAARDLGLTEGKPFFIPHARQVTDEEYEEQQERLKEGLIPDELDVGAYADEELRLKNE